MKTTVTVLGIIALLLFPPVVDAQAHPDGVALGGGYATTYQNYLNGLYLADKTGQFSTIVDTAALPRPNFFADTEMDTDNRALVFGCRGSIDTMYSLTAGLFRYDPVTSTYTTIARHPNDFDRIYGVEVSQDGDYWVSGRSIDTLNRVSHAVYRVSRTGGWTTVLTTTRFGSALSFNRPTGRDLLTGDLLVPADGSVGMYTRPVFALAQDGSVNTWHRSTGGPHPDYGWSQEIATGDMVYLKSGLLYRAKRGMFPEQVFPLSLSGEMAFGSAFENQSMPNPLLVIYSFKQSDVQTIANLRYVDPRPAGPIITKTITFLFGNRRVKIPYPTVDLLHYRNRYIQPIKTGSGQWDLHFSFPAHPNMAYAVAASLSGVRPGFRIPNQRHVWMNVDALFGLTVTNRIQPVFRPGPLVLDGNGYTKGGIGIAFLPLPLGITMHIVVAVLDGSAPGGVAFVTEPYPMQI